MIAPNPITTDDGRVFDRINLSVAISTRIENGAVVASAACRFVPSRVLEDGSGEELPEAASTMAIGNALELPDNTPEHRAMLAISAALTTMVQEKGI